MIKENASAHEDAHKMGGGFAGVAKQIQSRSNSVVAKAVLPSPEIVKKCLIYMDLGIKVQMIIFDLSSTIWWSTVAEIFVFFYGFWVFMVDAERMGFIWMFIPHVLRAVVGLLVIKKMPTSHEMVAGISIPPGEKIPFSKFDRFAVTGAKESVDRFSAAAGKFLLIYTILTVVCVALDFIVIFIGVGGLNSDAGPFGTVFVLLLAILYFLIALFFIGWVVSVRMRLPAFAQTQIMMGLLGLFKKLSTELETKY